MEKEKEVQLEDTSSLHAEMSSKISHAESLGIFTPEEAAQWQSGFDACGDNVEYMEGLIDIIDSFIDSGVAVMDQIEDLARHELVDAREGYQFVNEAESSSYQEKKSIIKELNAIIEKNDKLKKDLIDVLADKNISSSEKIQLITEFHVTQNKEKIIDQAKSIKVETTENKIDHYELIKQQIITMGHVKARRYLSVSQDKISFPEYVILDNLVDLKEVKHLSNSIKAA